MSDDAVMKSFFHLKSVLIEAQEEFGQELGIKLMAAAMKLKNEYGGTTSDAYYDIRDAYLETQK